MQTLDNLASTSAAMASLRQQHPLLATALERMDVQEGTEMTSSISTDGATVHLNPAFLSGREETAIVYMLAFLALAVIHDHQGRKGDRDHRVWGLASNISIHLSLAEAGITGRLPEADGLFDPTLAGMTIEEIHDALLDGRVKAFGIDIADVTRDMVESLPADA